jgi:hypothetical protein
MDFHREPEVSSAPIFLNELRARLFAHAHNVDKSLSAIFKRPPRMLLNYCNRKMPLHLRDDQLVASGQTLQSAINALDPGGWNAQPDYHPITWLRARYIFSCFKDEIFHVELRSKSTESEAVLR